MKRSMIIMISVILVLSIFLAACSKKETVTPTDAAATAAATPVADTSTPAATEAAVKSDKYDPPITITTVKSKAITVKYANGDSVDNNPWTRAYEEKYGIKQKTLWEVDPGQFEQKTNLAVASGDIPDFMNVSSQQFKQLSEAGLIMDLSEAYATAPEGVKGLLTEGGDLPLKAATIDGKLMAIPFTFGAKEGAKMLYIRTDWLKKLGLPDPKTTQDVLAISEAFTTKDPDGNNKADTFGLALDKDFSSLDGFLNSFHAYRGVWIKDSSGKLVEATMLPEMKTALLQLQNMFKTGQIDPEFGAKAFDKVSEDITNGKIGILYASPYSGLYPLQGVIDKNPNAEWKAFPITSNDDKPALNQVNAGVMSYWVVKKGFEHPEALFKMLDLWLKTFYENKDPAINTAMVNAADGTEIWQMNSISAYRAFKNVDQALKVTEALKTKDTSNLTGDDRGVYEKITKFEAGDKTMWGWKNIFGENGSMTVADNYRKNNLYMENQFYGAALPATTAKGPTLTKLINETFTKIIMNKVPIDEFDKLVANWKKLGGDEITQQTNDWAAGK